MIVMFGALGDGFNKHEYEFDKFFIRYWRTGDDSLYAIMSEIQTWRSDDYVLTRLKITPPVLVNDGQTFEFCVTGDLYVRRAPVADHQDYVSPEPAPIRWA